MKRSVCLFYLALADRYKAAISLWPSQAISSLLAHWRLCGFTRDLVARVHSESRETVTCWLGCAFFTMKYPVIMLCYCLLLKDLFHSLPTLLYFTIAVLLLFVYVAVFCLHKRGNYLLLSPYPWESSPDRPDSPCIQFLPCFIHPV